MLTEHERISLLMMREWDDCKWSYAQMIELFNQTFRIEDNDISKSIVIYTIQHFEETGFVIDKVY